MLAPYVPEDVAKFYPPEHKDPDGQFASFRVYLCIIAYNTKLVKKEDAPKSFADLLAAEMEGQDRQGASRLQRHHHDRDLTRCARDLGWGYFEKLAKQNVMQVQSAADPPKKLALGERAVMADGNEYIMFAEKERGQPVEPVYADRRHAADRRAERVVQGGAQSERGAAVPELSASTPECQQLCIDIGGLRSVHPQAKEKPGRTPLSRHQTDEGRSGGGIEARRRDQGALRQAVPRLMTAIAVHSAGRTGARFGFDLSKPVLLLFAAVLCVLIVLPLSWLVYYAFTDKNGAFTLANFGRLLSPTPTFSIRCSRPSCSRLCQPSSAARWRRRWAGWWRAPTCRCGAPCACW